MLRAEMNERATSTVKIEDIDANAFGMLLEFLYTGSIGCTMDGHWGDLDSVAPLLNAAEKYQVEGLKLKCFNNVCDKGLKKETLPRLIVLIHLYGAPESVKEEVYSFYTA
jgi:hypothetical protein